MEPRKNSRITESGVSEIVGALILIGMIVLVVAVISSFLVNRPASNQIPEVQIFSGQC